MRAHTHACMYARAHTHAPLHSRSYNITLVFSIHSENTCPVKRCCQWLFSHTQVWRGKLEDRDVAVKIYSSHYREYYNNERTLYRLPFMDFEGLVRFYGADERITQDGSAQLMIVMSYVPLGSLNSYLKNNTFDWPTMVRMAYSVAKALSHLHTDIQKGGET